MREKIRFIPLIWQTEMLESECQAALLGRPRMSRKQAYKYQECQKWLPGMTHFISSIDSIHPCCFKAKQQQHICDWWVEFFTSRKMPTPSSSSSSSFCLKRNRFNFFFFFFLKDWCELQEEEEVAPIYILATSQVLSLSLHLNSQVSVSNH